ncbi:MULTISPECIES: DotA/TraY family protein [Massilia]|jgi:conjugal transfer/type IV secretion protein DotA/TraY|uniref:DotA/TraY family protein n=1 Tax=Massilia TaxID=149698 RepID=UPI0004884439|nr:DotA/TraY family protein [Massilia alkalitolerans]
MRKHINSTHIRTGAAALACLLLPEVAHAGLLDDVTDLLTDINRETDESFAMLRAVLGDFALDPFRTQDGSTGTLLAAMFKEFNMFIFSAACIWMAYNMIAGLAQTMHEGVVLGKRMSTVWVPVRVAFGTASLMPVFGGWAFCQALMVVACLLGIAGANRVQQTAIDSTEAFHTTVNPMGNIKQAAQLKNMELYMAKAVACQRASQDMAAAMQTAGQPTPTDFPVTLNTDSGTAIVMKFAGRQPSGQFGSSACGEITMNFSPRSNSITQSTFGLRIADVNYEGIRKTSMDAHAATLQSTYAAAKDLITGVSPNSNKEQFDASVKTIADGYFGIYTNTFQGKLAALAAQANSVSNSGAISDQLTQRMKDGGWITLGIWYSVYAEVGEAMNEMLDPVVTFENMPDDEDMPSTTRELLAGLEAAVGVASAQKQGILPTSSTGNISVGQWILGGALNGMIGSSSTGAGETVNPIITFKNIGDNALAAAQAMYFAYRAADFVAGTRVGRAVIGAAESVANSSLGQKVLSVVPGGGIASTLSKIAKDAGGLMLPVLGLMFVSAAVMAFYIPMVPFIQWFAAIIQWFTSIIESLLGSSLWAMAHFDSDGEGMGQRTSYGYTYMLNNFARPIIMTFSFFIASAAVTVMGTFLFRYFGAAVGSAQGNSLTGLMSIAAYMVIFTVMGMTLVNSTFSVMLNLADRMIGWIGNNQNAVTGHEVESKVAGVFINAARGGSGAVSTSMKMKMAKDLKNNGQQGLAAAVIDQKKDY